MVNYLHNDFETGELKETANDIGYTQNDIDECGKILDRYVTPAPFTTYSLFLHGKFVTNEMFSDRKFIKFLEEKGGVEWSLFLQKQ